MTTGSSAKACAIAASRARRSSFFQKVTKSSSPSVNAHDELPEAGDGLGPQVEREVAAGAVDALDPFDVAVVEPHHGGRDGDEGGGVEAPVVGDGVGEP